MNSILITNIKSLVQVRENSLTRICGKEMAHLPCQDNAWLLIENGLIKDFGEMKSFISKSNAVEINAAGKYVLPCWCDSHTHLVYAGSREGEFVDRIKGMSYEEIAKRGGGILNSAKKLNDATEEELFESAWQRLEEIKSQGTGAVEIKSGYGLSYEGELKILRVIKKLKKKSPLTIKSTFLGAHAIPAEYKNNRNDYIKLLTEKLMPQIAKENLADYCDVFCEQNYFTKEETIFILKTAEKFGMKGKVHAEQLSHTGGIAAGVECNAISVDHLEYINDNDITLLKNSDTMPTLLPGAAFFLRLPYPPARKMIDSGLPVAVASDYNPGSSPSGNINLMLSLLCINHSMTPEESINAATINAAYAMGVVNELGSITKGKKANVMITRQVPSLSFIPYSFGNNLIEQVILNGIIQH